MLLFGPAESVLISQLMNISRYFKSVGVDSTISLRLEGVVGISGVFSMS